VHPQFTANLVFSSFFSPSFNSPTDQTAQPIFVVNISNGVFPRKDDPFRGHNDKFSLGAL
jgi:hypothetical protein